MADDSLSASGVRSLSIIAQQLRCEVDRAEEHWQSAVEHAIRAGELLIEAKAQVEHGEWLPWLKQNFPGSGRTARNYMRLAENRQRVADLPTVREAVALLAEPTPNSAVEGEEVSERDDEHGFKGEEEITAYIWGCDIPIPDRFVRAFVLMREVRLKDEALEGRLWMEPDDDFLPGLSDQDRRLRWLAPSPGSTSVATGRGMQRGLDLLAELRVLDGQIRELVPEVRDPGWLDEVARRAGEIVRALDDQLAKAI
jgi:hypothetical protein